MCHPKFPLRVEVSSRSSTRISFNFVGAARDKVSALWAFQYIDIPKAAQADRGASGYRLPRAPPLDFERF
jgi:hypothetical protein